MFMLFCSFVVFAMKSRADAAEAGDVASFEIGGAKLSVIVENESENEVKILINASDEDMKKYLPTGRAVSAVTVSVLEVGDEKILFDTGFGRSIESGLKKIGLTAADITKVFITHAHGDHIGGLLKDGARAWPNAKVFASKKEFEWSSQLRDMLKSYGDDVVLFEPASFESKGDALAENIYPIAAYGHTPGHTVFDFVSKGEELIIWGDIAHVMAIQMARPDISVAYDSDPKEAATARRAVLEYAAKNNATVAGMHIAYPSAGKIVREDDGFVFTKIR